MGERMRLQFLVLAMFVAMPSFGSLVAIIDSGTDYKHNDLANNIWTNPNEINDGNDNDHNGKVDDIYGWNLAEGTSRIYDPMYEYLINGNVLKFYNILAMAAAGTVSADDIAWYNLKNDDDSFMKDVEFIGGYAHGTHVAGISRLNNDNVELLTVKYLSTNYAKFISETAKLLSENIEATTPGMPEDKKTGENIIDMNMFKKYLTVQAMDFSQKLEEVATYVNSFNVRVANGSFGFGFLSAAEMIYAISMNAYETAPTENQLIELTIHFIASMIYGGEMALAKAENTLFVFAAGNDGTDNDIFIDAPSGIKRDNTISVAATYEDAMLADFSNFGPTTVEVAAPGVNINSSCPGQKKIILSGTSQAAPYVTNIASKVVDANPELTSGQVKQIIIDTVDKKDFLVGKVTSEGIVNGDRAVYMAQLLANNNNIDFSEAKESAFAKYPMKTNMKGPLFHYDFPIETIVVPRPLF